MKKKLQELLREKQALTSEQIESFYRNTDKFGNAFVINMASRTERLEQATKTLAKVDQRFYRFVTIVGKELMETDYHTQFDILRPGELGCLLSHLSIAALAADHPNENAYTIIFEDDIVTSSGRDAYSVSLQKLERIDQDENVQIIYLGKCLERCGQMTQVDDNIYRAVAPSCCHAYAIKNSFARRLFRDLDNCHKHEGSILNAAYFNRGIYSIYGDYIINGMIKGLVFHPSLFYQDVLSGGSDLRQEFMINYQECNDTNPGCPPPPPNEPYHRSKRKELFIIVLLITVIVVVILVWQRNRVRGLLKSGIGKGTLLFLGALLIGLVVIFCVLKLCKTRDRDRPSWLEGFHTPPKATLPALQEHCSNEPKHFLSDSKALASREYKVFNPNGLVTLIPDRLRSPSEVSWSRRSYDPNVGIVTTSRCCNGKVSYPLVQIYDSTLSELIYSKMVLVKSHRSVKSRHVLGYEDMRIFKYRNDFYLIGVNLDRSPQNLPGMVLVKLNADFDSEETWHLKYEPLATLPNKNWSPLILPDGELGLIVDIDPLLIVKRHKKTENPTNDRKGYSEICAKAYESPKQTAVEKVRNSSVTWEWKQVPKAFQAVFLSVFPQCSSLHKRYVLMGHTKYVDFVKDGWRVIYQHYFVIVDLPMSGGSGEKGKDSDCRVHLSEPFYVEENDRPHIEYISGFLFLPSSLGSAGNDVSDGGKLIVMYGLKDAESKYLEFTASDFRRVLHAKQ